jgi:hypothetical protein
MYKRVGSSKALNTIYPTSIFVLDDGNIALRLLEKEEEKMKEKADEDNETDEMVKMRCFNVVLLFIVMCGNNVCVQ